MLLLWCSFMHWFRRAVNIVLLATWNEFYASKSPAIDRFIACVCFRARKTWEWLWRLANASDLDLLLLLRSFLCSMVAQWSDFWLKLNIHAKLCYSFNGELLHNAVCCIQCNLETQWNNKPGEFQLELFSTLLATKISTTITNFLRSACATTLITVHNLICK